MRPFSLKCDFHTYGAMSEETSFLYNFPLYFRCQNTLEAHHQTLREMMKAELQAEYDTRINKAENQYTSEISKLR